MPFPSVYKGLASHQILLQQNHHFVSSELHFFRIVGCFILSATRTLVNPQSKVSTACLYLQKALSAIQRVVITQLFQKEHFKVDKANIYGQTQKNNTSWFVSLFLSRCSDIAATWVPLKLAAPALLSDPDKHKAESFIVSTLWLHVSYLKRLEMGPSSDRRNQRLPFGSGQAPMNDRLVSLLWMLALMCHGRSDHVYDLFFHSAQFPVRRCSLSAVTYVLWIFISGFDGHLKALNLAVTGIFYPLVLIY